MEMIKPLWRACGEVIEVLILATLFSVGAFYFNIYAITLYSNRAMSTFTDPNVTYFFDISIDMYWEISDLSTYPMIFIILVSLLIATLAIYFTIRNDQLTSAIRLFATFENINRLIYISLAFSRNWCLLNDCDQDSIFVWLPNNYSYIVLLLNVFCQTAISLNRFLAISFNGRFFMYTNKKPILQLVFCYLVAAIFIVYHEICDPVSNVQSLIQQSLVSLMITLDFFTFLKFRKRLVDAKTKSSRAEKCLMIQMACSSTLYLFVYTVKNLLICVFYLFSGLYVLLTLTLLSSLVRDTINTLGQSLVNVMFLRKPQKSTKEMSQTSTVGTSTQSTTRKNFSTTKTALVKF